MWRVSRAALEVQAWKLPTEVDRAAPGLLSARTTHHQQHVASLIARPPRAVSNAEKGNRIDATVSSSLAYAHLAEVLAVVDRIAAPQAVRFDEYL